MGSGMFDGLFVVFWLFWIVLPLAIWKLIDIIVFLLQHIKLV